MSLENDESYLSYAKPTRRNIMRRYFDFSNRTLEKQMFKIILLSFVVSTLLELLLHFLFLKSSGLMVQNAIWFFYLNVSSAFLIGGLWHYFAYKVKVNCMTGMMLAMSFGMQTGMMLGAVIGATNGFFIGATVGMLLGVGVGVWVGIHSGHTMGFVQGIMSGIMGGTMGAMITIMMLFDRLSLFMPLYILFNIAVIIFTSLMFYEESIEDEEHIRKNPLDTSTALFITIIFTVVMSALILFLPKSPFLLG
jgi:hypothetical protein